jgi:hypothetical protein
MTASATNASVPRAYNRDMITPLIAAFTLGTIGTVVTSLLGLLGGGLLTWLAPKVVVPATVANKYIAGIQAAAAQLLAAANSPSVDPAQIKAGLMSIYTSLVALAGS